MQTQNSFEKVSMILTFFYYHNNIKLQVHTNYKLHEMKKA